MKLRVTTYLTITTTIIFLLNSCGHINEHPKEKPSVIYGYDVDGKVKLAVNEFVDSLAKRKWPEKLLKDKEIDFREISDTFYIKKPYEDSVYVKYGKHYAIFSKRINFNSIWFGGLDYPRFIINCPIQFDNCTFSFNKYYACFHGVKFKSSVIFKDNIFPDSTLIHSITFEGNVSFSNNSLNGYSPKFSYCNFSKGIQFNSTDVVWAQTAMMNPLYIYETGSSFNDEVVFVNCKISGTLSFRNCKFNENSSILIDNKSIPDTLDMTSVKIKGRLHLPDISSQKGKICYLNLMNADIDKLIFRYDNYKLLFPNRYKNVSNDVISSTYERLLNNFKTIGFSDSYEKLDIEYSKWRSKSNRIYKLSDIWWKFGYQKWRILFFTFGFVFLFSVFNFNSYGILQEEYPVEKLSWSEIKHNSNPFYIFFRKFFSVIIFTGLIFFGLSIDFKNLNFKQMRFATLIIFQHIIGIICTGFLVNWILKS